jgi:hypothetical protein
MNEETNRDSAEANGDARFLKGAALVLTALLAAVSSGAASSNSASRRSAPSGSISSSLTARHG